MSGGGDREETKTWLDEQKQIWSRSLILVTIVENHRKGHSHPIWICFHQTPGISQHMEQGPLCGLFYILKSAKSIFHQTILGKMEVDEWAMELRDKWDWTYPITNYIEPDEPVIYDVHMDEIVPIAERSGSYYGLIFDPLYLIMEKALKLLMKKVT